MKRIPYLFLSVLLLFTLLTACQNKEATQQQEVQDNIQDLKNKGDIQAGAQVNTSVDEQGHTQFEYTNPDGSGGGGVILD